MTDASGAVVKFCDPNCTTPTTTYLVTWNGHGDAIGVWKIDPSTGALTLANSYTYTSWGAPTTTVASGFSDLGLRFLYDGAQDVQWDNFSGLGLYYMQARHYAPAIGRFLQPDPSRIEINDYGYVANNPVTLVDPSGLMKSIEGIGTADVDFMGGGVAEEAGGGYDLPGGSAIAAAGLALAAAEAANYRAVVRIIEALDPGTLDGRYCFAIGLDQPRVRRFAQIRDCSFMPDLFKDVPEPPGVQALSGATKVFLNVIWLEAQMSQRKVCYDLGPNGTGAGFSKYYFIERQLTRDYWPKVNYFYWDPID